MATVLMVAAGAVAGESITGPDRTDAVPDTVTELEILLQAPVSTVSQTAILRWMLRHHDAFYFQLPVDPTREAVYSHPIIRTLRRQTRSVAWTKACASLSTEERYRIFCLQRPREMPTVLPLTRSASPTVYRPVDLVPVGSLYHADLLRFVVNYLVEHAAEARYDGVLGRIHCAKTKLAKAPEYLWRFRRENPATFARALAGIRAAPLHRRLLADSFGETPASRVEPYDHLWIHLSSNLTDALTKLDRRPHIQRTNMNRVCRQVTDRVFGFPGHRHPAPPVAFGHTGDPQTRTFDLLCPGGRDTVFLGEPGSPRVRWLHDDGAGEPPPGRWIERIQLAPLPGGELTYGVFDLHPDLDKRDLHLLVRCPAGTYRLAFEVEQGTGVLPPIPPALRQDRATATGEINVVLSFALFPSLSEPSFGAAVRHLVQNGFRPSTGSITVNDLWRDFREEVARSNTSLVVPVYHVVDQERFRLGWSPARKMVFLKTLPAAESRGSVTRIRLAAYAPSTEATGEEVLLRRTEFGNLFRARLASPVAEDTLCLMNMSCFSQYTVESWMAAFREASRDWNPADIDPMSIPFLIGSRQGFDTQDPYRLLVYPARVMQSLCEGRTRPEILADLSTLDRHEFDPVSNLDRPGLLRMGGGFRLHVTEIGSPQRTASF